MAVDTARVEKLRKQPINGQSVKRLVEAGLTWLRTNQQTVNALNVFPVPDGDTGTNMVLTMQSAWNEIKDLGHRGISDMASAVSKGALMGARGNSGVILSQLWRGFARGVHGKEILDGPTLAKSFGEARDTAYKGVVRPVEGTILTVAKEVALATEAALKSTEDPIQILEVAVRAADAAVQKTPELLPVLKQAGVVDSGGKGLFFILEGMLRHIYGESLETPTMTGPGRQNVQSVAAVGNAAGTGARMALLNRGHRREIEAPLDKRDDVWRSLVNQIVAGSTSLDERQRALDGPDAGRPRRPGRRAWTRSAPRRGRCSRGRRCRSLRPGPRRWGRRYWPAR